MINPVYRAYEPIKGLLRTSGYRLFRDKLFLFDIVDSAWCKFKKQTVYDTFNGKVLKQIVKEIKK